LNLSSKKLPRKTDTPQFSRLATDQRELKRIRYSWRFSFSFLATRKKI
jgi:hypothetical protein